MSRYRFTEDAFVDDRYYEAGDIASTADSGGTLPVDWTPCAAVDPLDSDAVTAFWAAGPQVCGLVRPQWTGTAVQFPATRWTATPDGELFQWSLTGLGAGPRGVGRARRAVGAVRRMTALLAIEAIELQARLLAALGRLRGRLR